MIRQKLHPRDLVQLLQAVQFDPLIIVNINPFFLRDREHRLVMQPTNVVNRLHDVDLAVQFLRHPIDGGDVSLPPPQQKMPAVPRVIHTVRTEIAQVQFEVLRRGGDVDVFRNLVLSKLRRCFAVVRFEKPGKAKFVKPSIAIESQLPRVFR